MEPAMDIVGEDPNDANKIKSEGLKFVFNANRDTFPHNPCPYADDGNPDMYSKENIEKRNNLRNAHELKRAMDDFATK